MREQVLRDRILVEAVRRVREWHADDPKRADTCGDLCSAVAEWHKYLRERACPECTHDLDFGDDCFECGTGKHARMCKCGKGDFLCPCIQADVPCLGRT